MIEKNQLLDQTIALLRDCLPADSSFIGLHEPLFEGREWEYVRDCLDTGWVSTAGQYVGKFESALQEYTGARRAIAVVNGTAALHVCLLLAGVEAGEEVLMPSLTFVATANAVRYCGAVPHFVEIENISLGVDAAKLSNYLETIAELKDDGLFNRLTGRRIRALVPMHVFGHPADLDALADVADRYKLVLIEDAAESLGSFYKGKHTGTTGKLSALSFNGNKIITTGGGGAILTDDDALADRAKHLTTTAKLPHRWAFVHDEAGYNYRMPNLNAALGCAQLERLSSYVERKRRLAKHYEERFRDHPHMSFIAEPSYAQSNYWLNAIILSQEAAVYRDDLLEATNDAGIMTRPIWTPMHLLPPYQDCPAMDLGVTEDYYGRVINIPSSVKLGETHEE
ncbi:LegC family aminotransferase [Cohnella sp. JJ-181]|uniref:LegC family aminotransferase n=1 Tax=Cohnella rhizoplanae TaxID=2974897 RepID=UPI0022FF742A|nr:LegC family aminotransferase [Cohnella sp. JJ-181]CAI6084354.1 GDP-perosamine synthase [Cohnella sp. JJ-181]